MQLLYRGIAYESNTQSAQNPSAPDGSIYLGKRLSYRGNSYDYQPQVTDANTESNGFYITLIYRGQAYQRKLPIPPVYHRAKAANLRWQSSQA